MDPIYVQKTDPKKTLRLPPQNLEAEQSVLGSILIDKNAIVKVIDMLVPSDFYTPVHERIFETILELFEKSQPIDVVSLTNRLKEKNILLEKKKIMKLKFLNIKKQAGQNILGNKNSQDLITIIY